MPDIWLDVDAALSEVPVNILPLIDDTDFKTRETGIVYNSAGMDLVWNFVSTAGAYTQTAVTPTTAGDYDWAHQGDGMYSIEIPASGGASINNDTEGHGWFTGFVTGVLPWRSPVIGFRASGLNDKLIDSAYSTTIGLSGTNLDAAITTRGSSTELAKVPKSDGSSSWNATALAAINAECDTALSDYDGPTNAEMEARTLPSADYFDPAADTVALVTDITTKTGFSLSTAGIDAIWDISLSLGLSPEVLIERIYQLVNNEMNIVDATGNVALRNLDDDADIATGGITDSLGTTSRQAYSWV